MNAYLLLIFIGRILAKYPTNHMTREIYDFVAEHGSKKQYLCIQQGRKELEAENKQHEQNTHQH